MANFQKIIIIQFLFLFCNINNILPQDTLKLDQAIAIALQNNYSIIIARNNAEISKNNNTIGNAGLLPGVSVSGTNSKTIYNTRSEDFSENITEINSTSTNALSANIMLNWTIFDGFEMFIEKDRLSEYQKISEERLKLEVENLVSEISSVYYGIVQQQKRLKILQNAMNFSNKRKELAEAKYRLGSFSELNYLQAFVDLNSDSTALIIQLTDLKNSKAELNNMLARDIQLEYQIVDSITVDSIVSYSELFANLEKENTEIGLSKSTIDVALMSYRLTNSPKYPTINFFAGYNFSRTQYETGNSKSYQYLGPIIGVNLSYNLFNGFNKRRNTANAKIQIKTGETELRQTISNIQTQFFTLYNDYLTNLDLIKFETENIKAARKTTFVAFERYKLGEISDIELRQTQLKELEAENQLLQAQFKAKLLETELLRLSGKLIKD